MLDKKSTVLCSDFTIQCFCGRQQNSNGPHEMKIQLIKGPFKTLSGFWKFTKIDNMSCKVDLVLDYDFSNYLLEKLIGPVFNIIANSFIDEFIKEANHRYK